MTHNQTLPTIPWTANKSELIYKLLTELAKKENHVALYGVQKGNKTIGSSKSKVHKEIASVLFPELFSGNEEVLASRVKGKIEDLYSRYKKELKRITVTGGGIGGNDEDPAQSESQEDSVSYFIGADGPDDATPSKARNIWEKINRTFPFFAEMHRYLCGHPNAIPPLVTTGVGPAGHSVVQFQPIGEEPLQVLASMEPTEPQLVTNNSVPPTTPVHSSASAEPLKATQVQVTAKKRSAKASSFAITDAAVEKAKSSIQRVQKKTFEERLGDAAEAHLELANCREAAAHRLDKQRLILDQISQVNKKRDQILAFVTANIYSVSKAKRQLRELDAQEAELQRGIKRPKVRSPSPASSSSVRPSSPIQPSSPLLPSSPLHNLSPVQAHSIEWDIEHGESLPHTDSDTF
ncbi:hypothetical protein CPB84DRAFT_1969532 [Gymnopilus junonius]|uniref:Uncharacterized protein n=1 Tax=Gymnopilus junonius TaxID=109634 RepID=A0A9P5TFM7_GYMJU|nr:hypothetical protein CPB84DRAFT_1969532 [Gymnopilus junonius]